METTPSQSSSVELSNVTVVNTSAISRSPSKQKPLSSKKGLKVKRISKCSKTKKSGNSKYFPIFKQSKPVNSSDESESDRSFTDVLRDALAETQGSSEEELSQSHEGGEGGRDATDAHQNGGDDEIRPCQSADGTSNGSESPELSGNTHGSADPPHDLPNGGPPGQPSAEAQAQVNRRPSHSEPVNPEVLYLREANKKLINQMQKCENENENLKKQSTNQKSQIKKLTNKCDALQRKLSKISGMRKFAEKNTIEAPTSTLSTDEMNKQFDQMKCERDLSNAKYVSLKEHITVVTKNLYSVLEEEPAPDANTHEKKNVSNTKVKNNKRVRFRPANVRVSFSDSGRSSINVNQTQRINVVSGMGRNSPTPTPKPVKSGESILYGTSLVSGMGAELRDRGINATSISHPGGKTEYMSKTAYNTFANMKNPPANIIVQTAGNCCDDFKIPSGKIIENYETTIQEIRRASPDSRIICSSVPLRGDNPVVHMKINKVNAYLKRRGERNLDNMFFIDVVPKDMRTMYKKDKVHFNGKGRAEYARGLKEAILNFPQSVRQNIM